MDAADESNLRLHMCGTLKAPQSMMRGRNLAQYQSYVGHSLYKMIMQRLQPGATILDIGCGHAHAASELKDERPEVRVIGLDFAIWALDVGHQIYPQNTRVPCVAANAQALPLPDNSVDAAVSVWTFPYIADKLQAVREMHRVLKPQGIGVFAWDNLGMLLEPENLLHYSRSDSDAFWSELGRGLSGRMQGVIVEKQGRGLAFEERKPKLLTYTVAEIGAPVVTSSYSVSPTCPERFP